MRLTPPEQNAFQTTRQLLRLAQVRLTDGSLKKALCFHPDFPSLLAIGDVLKEYRVDSLATRLSAERLIEAPLPALAYLQYANGGEFVTLRSITHDKVEWYHEKWGWKSESLGDFLAHWNGVLLLIEPGTGAGETDYPRQRRREIREALRFPFVLISLLLCLGLALAWNGLLLESYPGYYALLALKLAGTVLSSLLVWYSLDAENPVLRRICQISTRTNCRSLLDASAARLLGGLSWAEIGLFYFGGGLVALLVGAREQETLLPILFRFNLLALPYTLWSVYYQGRIARQWCPLCLAVQVLLWLEFAVGQWIGGRVAFSNFSISGPVVVIIGTSFLGIVALWVAIKPLLGPALRHETLLRTLQQFKFNPDYLRALVTRARPLPPVFKEMEPLTLGNPMAENTLTLVLSPTCAACRHHFQELDRLLAQGLDTVTGRIILAAGGSANNESSQIARSILALPEFQRINALRDWFAAEHPSVKKWQATHPADWQSPEAAQQLSLHGRWCRLANITRTPTLFLDNLELSSEYTINEIPKILMNLFPADLLDHYKSNNFPT